MYNINYADDNVEKSRTFAESFRELAQAARKPRIICRSGQRRVKSATNVFLSGAGVAINVQLRLGNVTGVGSWDILVKALYARGRTKG